MKAVLAEHDLHMEQPNDCARGVFNERSAPSELSPISDASLAHSLQSLQLLAPFVLFFSRAFSHMSARVCFLKGPDDVKVPLLVFCGNVPVAG